MVSNKNKVKLTEVTIYQPKRLTDSFRNYTPLQHDMVTLLQKAIQLSTRESKEKFHDRFKIDFKEYFEYKGIENQEKMVNHYLEVINEMTSIKMHYRPDYTRPELITTTIISTVIHKGNFEFEIVIPNAALPLFYNGKFKLIKKWWDSPESKIFVPIQAEDKKELKYSTKKDLVSIDYKSAPEKLLYEELIRHKQHGKYTFRYSKEGIYRVLGFLKVKKKEDNQLRLFPFQDYELVPIKYEGREGWGSLSKALNKWLKNISEDKKNGLKVVTNEKGKFFTTAGRPIKEVSISVEYENLVLNYNAEQKDCYNFLTERYGVKNKQAEHIISKHACDYIKKQIKEHIVKKKDQRTGKEYYGKYKTANHDKIDNVAGYIYAYLFKMTNQ